MGDTSDWEPLPPERLGLHPGEHVDLGAREPAPPPPPAAEGAAGGAADEPAAPADPEAARREETAAEAALAELRRRIAAAPRRDTLLVDIERANRKADRRRRAARSARLRECAVVASRVTAADLPLEVDYDRGPEGRDPREDEGWFRELPGHEQARLHDVWARQRAQLQGSGRAQQRTRLRRAVAALLAFALVAVLGTPGGVPATLTAGLLCALVWYHQAPCRYGYALSGFGCLLVVHVTSLALHGGGGLGFGFMDGILVMAVSAVVGFDGEIRRTGGFDAR